MFDIARMWRDDSIAEIKIHVEFKEFLNQANVFIRPQV